MQDIKEVTFFMLVTNRDCIMADFAIRSYEKIYNVKQKFGHTDFVLFVYLNCLSEENKSYYVPLWNSLPYTELYDNKERINNTNAPYPGQEIKSPEGIVRTREDFTENCDELWTTELKKFSSPFIATVDADFEVLNADFYFYLIQKLDNDAGSIGASTSYNATSHLYDSYSGRQIILHERNHTWFCLYRKEAFSLSTVSHYYYEELNNEGIVSAFDSAAYFQHDLRTNHHRNFILLPPEFRSSFVHYGAASKNASINRQNIAFYRRAVLLSTVGLIYRREKTLVYKVINKAVRTACSIVYGRYLKKISDERSRYVYKNDNPAGETTA